MGLESVRSAAIAALLAAAAVSAPGRPAEPPPPEPVPRFHADPGEIEEAVLGATLALLSEDMQGTRSALDRMEEGCVRISQDDDPSLSWQLAAFDAGFHRQLDAARESALRGDVEGTAQGLAWLQRSCRECHRQAEADGRKPPRAPRGSPPGQERQSRG